MPGTAENASPPRHRVTLLRASRLLLDAGGMFGVIPRVVWERFTSPSEKHQLELSHNCLVLEPLDDAGDVSGRPILIESGSGDKLDPKMTGIFGLDGRTAETEARNAGFEPESFGSTVVSHLHFDHAGGLTRRVRGGERPDWEAKPGEASGDEPRVRFSFPDAQLIVQRREWEDALANNAVMTKTYYRDHLLPYADERNATLADGRPRVRLIESPPPFERPGHPPADAKPAGELEARMTEVLPGVFVFLVPGHTWGQQAVLFHDGAGRPTVFVPDVMPTSWHLGRAYSLAYDTEPYTSMLSKSWLLAEAAARGWVLCLDHEPGEPFFTVEPNSKGWFSLVPAPPPGA